MGAGEDGWELVGLAPWKWHLEMEASSQWTPPSSIPQGYRRIVPPQASPHYVPCQWSAIYMSAQSSTYFTPEGVIELQSARYITTSHWISLKQPAQEMEFVVTPTRQILTQISGHWLCPFGPIVPTFNARLLEDQLLFQLIQLFTIHRW